MPKLFGLLAVIVTVSFGGSKLVNKLLFEVKKEAVTRLHKGLPPCFVIDLVVIKRNIIKEFEYFLFDGVNTRIGPINFVDYADNLDVFFESLAQHKSCLR